MGRSSTRQPHPARLPPLDRQPSHSHASVADHHEGASGKVAVDLNKVGEQQLGLGLWAPGHLSSEEHDAREHIT
jgi:hypothetical protein